MPFWKKFQLHQVSKLWCHRTWHPPSVFSQVLSLLSLDPHFQPSLPGDIICGRVHWKTKFRRKTANITGHCWPKFRWNSGQGISVQTVQGYRIVLNPWRKNLICALSARNDSKSVHTWQLVELLSAHHLLHSEANFQWEYRPNIESADSSVAVKRAMECFLHFSFWYKECVKYYF